MEEQIAQDKWAAFLTDFDRAHQGNEARIEIIGREFGDQEEAAWLPLSGLSYDPHGNQVIITVGGINSRYPAHLTHMISQPTQIAVSEPSEGTQSSILILAPDETKTLLHVRPLARLTA